MHNAIELRNGNLNILTMNIHFTILLLNIHNIIQLACLKPLALLQFGYQRSIRSQLFTIFVPYLQKARVFYTFYLLFIFSYLQLYLDNI